MSSVTEIVKAVEGLAPSDFMKLRRVLDRLEEKLWDQELAQATQKHRKNGLTDAKIDDLVLKRRYRNRA